MQQCSYLGDDMKKRIKISEDFLIKEVDAEIVKIGPFYFGLFWNENEYSEHRITAVEVTSGLVAGVVYKKRNKAPKKKLLENIERLVAAGHVEDDLAGPGGQQGHRRHGAGLLEIV